MVKKSFLDAIKVPTSSGFPLKVAPMRVEEGNVIAEVDEYDIECETIKYHFDVIGRIVYQKGDKPHSVGDLKHKLYEH